jgi:hypothetical protein
MTIFIVVVAETGAGGESHSSRDYMGETTAPTGLLAIRVPGRQILGPAQGAPSGG